MSLFYHLVFIIRNDLTIDVLSGNKVLWRHMKSYWRSYFSLPQILCYCFHDVVQISCIIMILSLLYIEMNLISFFVVILVKYIARGNVVVNLLFQNYSRLISPTSTHILYCVSSATQQYHGHAKTFHEIHCLSMSSDC